VTFASSYCTPETEEREMDGSMEDEKLLWARPQFEFKLGLSLTFGLGEIERDENLQKPDHVFTLND
jgi:hypothetical protein